MPVQLRNKPGNEQLTILRLNLFGYLAQGKEAKADLGIVDRTVVRKRLLTIKKRIPCGLNCIDYSQVEPLQKCYCLERTGREIVLKCLFGLKRKTSPCR